MIRCKKGKVRKNEKKVLFHVLKKQNKKQKKKTKGVKTYVDHVQDIFFNCTTIGRFGRYTSRPVSKDGRFVSSYY